MNSNLYNKTIELPQEVIEYLQSCFDYIPNSDSSIEGHKRNEELRNSGYVTYQQLGRMKNWVNKTIQDLRNQDTTHSEVEDIMPDRIDDKFIDNLGPIADMMRPSKEHSTFTQDIRIKEDLDRINDLIKKII